jgi:hypothetical protein
MPTPNPQTADCVFCAIVRGEAPATFLHQDNTVVAFMDNRPVQPGHLLVVPRAHAKLIPDLDPDILVRLWAVATDLNHGAQPPRTELERIADQIRPGILPTSAPESSGG